MQSWTKEEILLLEQYWATETRPFIQKAIPNKTWAAINHKAQKLRLPRKAETYWNDSELAILINQWPIANRAHIQSLLPNRSWISIKCKASMLQLKKSASQEKPILSGRQYKSDILITKPTLFKFAIVTDTHFGSKYAQITWLHDFYKLAARKGIKTFFHAGDLSDGNGTHYPGQRFEMHLTGVDNLKNFIIKNYPKVADAKTYIISGWHDLDLWTKEGYDLLGRVSEIRKDLIYLGQNDSTFILGNRRIYLIHPGGGTAYALSYKAQKLVESFSSEHKPHIIIIGHFHKAEFIPVLRNVFVFQGGCFQYQTPFAIRHNIQFQYGGWFVEMELDKKGIQTMKSQFIPFYVPILNDYRNYE